MHMLLKNCFLIKSIIWLIVLVICMLFRLFLLLLFYRQSKKFNCDMKNNFENNKSNIKLKLNTLPIVLQLNDVFFSA